MTVRNVLGRWSRKVGEATKKAETLAGNTWQHCTFSVHLMVLVRRNVFSYQVGAG